MARVWTTPGWTLIVAAALLRVAAGQQYASPPPSSGQRPRIALEFNLPLGELVDTCHAYAEHKAFPLRRRIAELEDEVRALRSGQEYVPPPPSYSPPPPPPPPPHYGNGYYPGATGMNNPPLGYNPAFYRDYPPETGADPNYINGEPAGPAPRNRACASAPCANGGTCTPHAVGYGFRCDCAANYSGATCQFKSRRSFHAGRTGVLGEGGTGAVPAPVGHVNTSTEGQQPHSFNMNAFPRSCRQIHERNVRARTESRLYDGVYTIRPDPTRHTVPVFCNMTAGGWTLVYAYTFTKPGPKTSDFTTMQNAVTPVPSWPIKASEHRTVPISNTSPRNETDFNAVDFSLWKFIGSEFILKTNFVNWYHCRPVNGSLVKMKKGSVSCVMIHKLYHHSFVGCQGSPNLFEPESYNYGPRLGTVEGTYFYWDSSELFNFPAHNPCDSYNMPDNLDLSNPRGAIYLY